MIRNLNARSFKPMLEQLEDRVTPTVLLGNSQVVTAMTDGLNNVLADMKTAATNLQTDIKAATTAATLPLTATSFQNWINAVGKATADYQQILSDQASIHQMVSTDQAVLKGVAFAELTNGDPIDFLILTFFPNSGFNSASKLMNIQTSADNIVNGTDTANGNVKTEVTTPLNIPTTGAPTFTITIANEVTKPSFGQP